MTIQRAKASLKLGKLRKFADLHLDLIQAKVDELVISKGDTSSTCQRQYITNQLKEVAQAFNGLEVNDLLKT